MNDRPAPVKSVSYGALVWGQFRRNLIALAALALIVVLFLFAVFAPFLANDRPLLVRVKAARAAPFVTYDGQTAVVRTGWFSPVLEGLAKTDVAILVVFASAIVLTALRRLTVAADDPHRQGWRLPRGVRRALLWGVAAAAALLCAWLMTSGPRVIDERTNWQKLAKDVSTGDRFTRTPVPHSPDHEYLDERLSGPCARFWLGTDQMGRDVASQLIHGTRISLAIGFVAVGISAVIGTFLGALGGYFGRKVDFWVMRLIEVMMCFPTLFLIITISVVVKERSIWTVMVIIGITSWTGAAQLVRGEFLKQREMEYVTAAEAVGGGSLRVMFRHILPNAMAPLLVTVTFGVAAAVTTESVLSFLSLGVPPEAPTWGRILAAGLANVQYAWWLATFPGLAIFITVLAYNLAGEGLRDAIDPRMRI